MDEDLIPLIDKYDSAAIALENALQQLNCAQREHSAATTNLNAAAEPLKKRCGARIMKRFLQAASGNVYEVTEKDIVKIEIKRSRG